MCSTKDWYACATNEIHRFVHSNWQLWWNGIDMFYYISVLVCITVWQYCNQAELQYHVQQQN